FGRPVLAEVTKVLSRPDFLLCRAVQPGRDDNGEASTTGGRAQEMAGGKYEEAGAMRRRTFDALVTGAGLILAVLLLIAGGLLIWGHSFVDSQVRTQLAAQKIYFPPDKSPAIRAPEFAAMHQYAGQLMTSGAQAEVYADHFIANHLKEIGGGLTYSQ